MFHAAVPLRRPACHGSRAGTWLTQADVAGEDILQEVGQVPPGGQDEGVPHRRVVDLLETRANDWQTPAWWETTGK